MTDAMPCIFTVTGRSMICYQELSSIALILSTSLLERPAFRASWLLIHEYQKQDLLPDQVHWRTG